MLFCPRNESLKDIWVKGGISQCFIETVSSSICFGLLLLIGIPVVYILSKRQNVIERTKSVFYKIQIISMFFLVLSEVIRLILQGTTLYDKTYYGYMILMFLNNFLSEFVAILIIIYERKYSRTNSHSIALTGFWILKFVQLNLPFTSFNSPFWWWMHKNKSDTIELCIWAIRYALSFMILVLGINAPGLKIKVAYQRLASVNMVDEENLSASEGSTWKNLIKRFSMILDVTWPKDSYFLQFKILICMTMLVLGRIANLYIPITYKYVVDSLTPSTSKNKTSSQFEDYSDSTYLQVLLGKVSDFSANATGLTFRWDLVLVFTGLRILQGAGFGSGGVLNGIRTQLWITVQQYSSRRMGVNLFAHLHALSLKWHLSKKTGEVLRIMDRGTDSLQSLLSYIIFNIVPTIADILIGIVYFASAFNGYFALLVLSTMILYLGSTILVTEWRTKYRRSMNLMDNAKNAKAVDSLLNFETVKYYGAENHEVKTYRDAILEYQKADWISQSSLNLLNLVQNIVINTGFMGGALLCAHYIVLGQHFTVGDFVLYCTYIVQLNTPLNFFGTYYRMIQQNFIDMENMFDLLTVNQEIQDSETASTLMIRYGEIEFKNVCFSYKPEKPILRNISFKVPAGQTFALVGNSGGGKSTIVRLLFRFYDIDSGSITIDGQDIQEVTQQSLRQSIGVVPQDTVLFNQTIRENIRYGRLDATDQEIESAAAAADIHERIMGFPDQYDTMVGERGLKLSGGEKQRVAIARTLLKSPKIVLLDEATSALDTTTERNIQASLAKISVNRTCITVAHRLSTIVDADQILVIKDGTIEERGRHGELINIPNGIYAGLWQQQNSSNDAELSSPSGGSASGSDK